MGALAAQPASRLALGRSSNERTDAYRALLGQAHGDETLADSLVHLQQQRALGHDAFRAMVEAKAARFAGVRRAHRPPRPTPSTGK